MSEQSAGKSRFAFTQARIEKIEWKPDPANTKRDRFYVYDTHTKGLCLQVTSAGSKTFYLYRKVDGRPERIRLESFPAVNVDRARELAQIHVGEIAGGGNPAEQRRLARGEITLGALFERFINDHAKAHKKTWQDDQDQYDRYLTHWTNRKLSSIKRGDVQRLHTETGATKGHYTANRLLALLSTVFNFAPMLGYEGMNPAKGIKRFPEQSRERFVQPDEVPAFFKSLDKHHDQSMADFFRVALFTGARRANVQSMAWADVNFGRRTWTIPAGQTKNAAPLTIHLSDPTMEALQRRWAERVDGSAYVFPSRGKTGHIVEPKGAWKEILERAGITDLRLHDLRRTLGSWQAAAGISLPIIGKSLGHKSQSTTAIYSRLNLAPVAAAVDVAAAAIIAAAKPAKKSKKKATA